MGLAHRDPSAYPRRVMRLSAYLLPARSILPVLLLALGAGCAGEHDATEKQISELRAEIARLRAGQASLGERLDAVDIERGAFARGAMPSPPGAAGPSAIAAVTAPAASPPSATSGARPRATPDDRDRPALDVVRLSPSEGDGDADNDPSRPVVRAVGDGEGARAPTPTLNNRSLGARNAKRGVTAATPKKTADADARPVAKP
jgi:hypothetical protein